MKTRLASMRAAAYTSLMDTITRKVDELPDVQRTALEQLLGQPLDPGQQIFITAFSVGGTVDNAARTQARQRLQSTLQAAQRHAEQNNVTPEEADAAVAEAMDAIRPRSG